MDVEPSVTKQYKLVTVKQGAVVLCGWEGNRRSGVALAKRHRPVVYPITGSRPRQGDEHPAYALLWSMAHLPLPLQFTQSQWPYDVSGQRLRLRSEKRPVYYSAGTGNKLTRTVAVGMSVLREYAIAAYFTCCRAFFAYFSKVRIPHIFPHKLAL